MQKTLCAAPKRADGREMREPCWCQVSRALKGKASPVVLLIKSFIGFVTSAHKPAKERHTMSVPGNDLTLQIAVDEVEDTSDCNRPRVR
jgi:hypothetical protein